MKKISETEKQAGKNKEVPLQKDFAHYPPASTKQVKPHAHKKDKKEDDENTAETQPGNATITGNENEKAVNGSRKIVNSVDESYSDGSGGGFEATEQVNE